MTDRIPAERHGTIQPPRVCLQLYTILTDRSKTRIYLHMPGRFVPIFKTHVFTNCSQTSEWLGAAEVRNNLTRFFTLVFPLLSCTVLFRSNQFRIVISPGQF
jgi:hypothetical protein